MLFRSAVLAGGEEDGFGESTPVLLGCRADGVDAKTQVPQVYNDALRSLVRKTVKSMALKRDFGARIKEGGVGLVLAAAGKKGATEKEARLFVEGL